MSLFWSLDTATLTNDLSTAEAELRTADAGITSKEEVAVSVLLALVRGKFGFST